MKQKIISFLLSPLLVLYMALVLLPGVAHAAEASGTCGENLSWSYHDGTLTIQGVGSMEDYEAIPIDLVSFDVPRPWSNYLDKIHTVIIGDGVTRIGDHSLSYLSNLTSVTIPNSVTSIGRSAFSECRNLRSVTIPNSVTSIDDCAFHFCTSLTNMDIPSGVTSLSGTFWGCKALTNVTIPDSVTYLGAETFYGCESLRSVTVPSSVTTINYHAFFLGFDATSEDTKTLSLTDIYYTGSESQWGQITIEYPFDRGAAKLLTDATIHFNSSGPISAPSEIDPGPGIRSTGFADVKASDYFATPVAWAIEKGITNGTGDNKFSPGQNCTNAQILTFLWRAYGKPEPTISNPFTNSIPDAYTKAAIWAYEKGMVSGTTFDVDGLCSRSLAVTYMWQAAGCPTPATSSSFTDVPADAAFATAVSWAVENAITTGTSATTFAPNDICTRGHIVTFLHRNLA